MTAKRWMNGAATAAALAMAGGTLAAWSGAASPFLGFRVFALGLLAGAVVGIVAVVARLRGARWGAVPLVVGVVAIAILALGLRSAGQVPRIHDVATRWEPPIELPGGEDPSVPRDVIEQGRAAYPDVAPLRLDRPPGVAWGLVERLARERPDWEIALVDPRTRRIEAVATSMLFRFRDDVVIEVAPDPAAPRGSRIDMRSRSRVGESDLGANARRIRRFLSDLAAR